MVYSPATILRACLARPTTPSKSSALSSLFRDLRALHRPSPPTLFSAFRSSRTSSAIELRLQALSLQSLPHSFRHHGGRGISDCSNRVSSAFPTALSTFRPRLSPFASVSVFFSYSSALFYSSQGAISRLFINSRSLTAKTPGWGIAPSLSLLRYFLTSLPLDPFCPSPNTSATDHGPRYTSSRPIAPHPAKCQNFPCCLLRNTRPSRPAAGTQFRLFRCLTGKRTLGTATPHRRSWSPAGLQSQDRTRKKAWVFRSPSERLARGCSRERPNCSKVRSPHRAGKAGSVRLG